MPYLIARLWLWQGQSDCVALVPQLKEVQALIQNDLFEMKDELTTARRGLSVSGASQRSMMSISDGRHGVQ